MTFRNFTKDKPFSGSVYASEDIPGITSLSRAAVKRKSVGCPPGALVKLWENGKPLQL